MAKQYRSRMMAAIHETADDLHSAGLVDKRTMRRFDEACLTPVRPFRPEEDPGIAKRRGGKPGGVRSVFECDHGPGQPVGTWREASARCVTQVADVGRARWSRGGGVMQIQAGEVMAARRLVACYRWAMDREDIIARLRENEAALRARGVTHAALFGSRARGDAREDSDTDIMIEIDPDARIGCVGLCRDQGLHRWVVRWSCGCREAEDPAIFTSALRWLAEAIRGF